MCCLGANIECLLRQLPEPANLEEYFRGSHMTFKSVAEFLDDAKGHNPTEAERKLIEGTQTGKGCYLCDTENPILPAAATEANRIRAELLRVLIFGGTERCGLNKFGVRLLGGWIEGTLDLSFCTASGQTALCFCHFTHAPNFNQTTFLQLSLKNSFVPGLFAQGAQIAGDVFLLDVTSMGTVDLGGAEIGGQPDCYNSRFEGGKDIAGKQLPALNAQGVEVRQDIILSAFTATGTVDVNGAKIGGQLACNAGHFEGGKDKDGSQLKALNAQSVEVGQGVFLRSITARGTVNVSGAKIGGQLDCEGARFDGGKDKDCRQQKALNAQHMQVTKSFCFRELTDLKGGIDLTAVNVGDLVDDIGGILSPNTARIASISFWSPTGVDVP